MKIITFIKIGTFIGIKNYKTQCNYEKEVQSCNYAYIDMSKTKVE